MVKSNKNVVEAHKVERAINIIMLIFGVCAVLVFGLGLSNPDFGKEAVVIEMFLIVIIAILAQTAILAKMLERIM
jgi:multisubunit Na+/H+ antiporter MnhB subunit